MLEIYDDVLLFKQFKDHLLFINLSNGSYTEVPNFKKALYIEQIKNT